MSQSLTKCPASCLKEVDLNDNTNNVIKLELNTI